MAFITYIHFFCFILYTSLAIFILVRNPRSSLNRACFATLLCFSIWSFGLTFVHNVSVSKSTAVRFENIASIGWLYFSIFFLWFSAAFVGRFKSSKWRFLLLSCFAISFILLYQQWSGNLISNHMRKPFGWIGTWSDSLWSSLFYCYYIVLVVTGLYLILDFRNRTTELFKKRQAEIILITGLIPFILGSISNVLLRQMGYYNLPPLADILILSWALGMVYAISKYRFLSITPTVAADKIISTMTDFLVLLDPQGNIVSVNRAALNLLAYDEKELKRRSVTCLFADNESSKDIVKKLINGSMFNDYEIHIKTKEGRELPVSLTTSQLEGSGFVCIARDITLQKRSKEALQKAKDELDIKVRERTEELRVANKELTEEIEQRRMVEKQLRDSEARFKTMFEYAPDGYYMNDLKGTFIDGNKEAERITGYSKKELVGKNFLKLNLLPVSQISKAARLLAMNFINKPTGPDEFILNRKDGTQISVEISTYPLKVQDKQLVLGIARDISQRKVSEDEKTRLEEQLHQAQKMEAIGMLAGGIAHDFNNMLGAISGYANMIKTSFAQDNPKLLKYTNGIIGAAKRSADLTTQLLAYARKGKYIPAIVDMHEVVQDVINILTHTIDKRIEISKHLGAKPPNVMGDYSQLQNAFLNIAINALDAMPDGGALSFTTDIVEIDSEYIKTRAYKIKEGNYLMLSIYDTGIGMDKKTEEKAFEPFFTTKEPGKGTGLGLSGVYGTAKGHGGFIELESEPGKGTKVSMYIPHIQRRVREAFDAPRTTADGSGNILLVDDEAYIREMVSEALGELGYTVATCKDGKEAVKYYRKHHMNIDLVILDLIMPKMGGYDCLIELKKINPAARVLISSGYSDSEESKKVIEKGVVGYVQKPFDLTKFSQAVKEAITMGSNT